MGFRDEAALVLRGARMQRRVIGALIIRELHSRFGRHYYGYIWLFFEPLLLGSAIGLVHLLKDHPAQFGPFEFFAIGYIMYFIFRGVVNRATVAVPSNMNLLYHRTVTLPDIFFARHIIETISCSGVMLVFLLALFAVNGEMVEDPTKIILALIGMTLLSQGLAFIFHGYRAHQRAQILPNQGRPQDRAEGCLRQDSARREDWYSGKKWLRQIHDCAHAGRR